MPDDLQQQVLDASRRPEVLAAVERIYRQLEQDIDSRKPLCSAAGQCCRFEQYGHRLYVSTLELAAFVAQLPPTQPQQAAWDGTGCPFQLNGLCSVHPIRPFGCRIFFCDPTAAAWQSDRYEHYHAQLKQLHHDLNVPYHYVEWRQALQACQIASIPEGAGRSSACTSPRAPASLPLSLPQLPL